MAALLDADCIVAGTLAKRGAAHRLLGFWWAGDLEIVTCPRLVEEVRSTLLEPRIFARYSLDLSHLAELTEALSERTLAFENPRDPPRVVPDDPDDDYLVALGLSAKAEALVSRDKHLGPVEIKELPIMYPGEFLTLFESRLGSD